jgi:hypothetical protein
MESDLQSLPVSKIPNIKDFGLVCLRDQREMQVSQVSEDEDKICTDAFLNKEV